LFHPCSGGAFALIVLDDRGRRETEVSKLEALATPA
jgi:hypothetical protein